MIRIAFSHGLVAIAIVAAAVILRVGPVGRADEKAARVVEAERFVLRDGAGRARSEIGIEEDGTVAWRVFYADGELAASLTTEEARRGVHLRLTGPEGTGELQLNVANDIAGMQLFSGDDEKAFEFAACNTHACFHAFDREDEGTSATLHVNAGGTGFFGLSAGGEAGFSTGVNRRDSAHVKLEGRRSRIRIEEEIDVDDEAASKPFRLQIEKKDSSVIAEFPGRRGPI